MSHVVELKTQIRDMNALRTAAERRKVQVEIAAEGKTVSRSLYAGAEQGVAAIDGLSGWKYPVMVQADGTCKYDNYNGSWGHQRELDGLVAAYSEAVTDQHMLQSGYRQQERTVEADGTVELVYVG